MLFLADLIAEISGAMPSLGWTRSFRAFSPSGGFYPAHIPCVTVYDVNQSARHGPVTLRKSGSDVDSVIRSLRKSLTMVGHLTISGRYSSGLLTATFCNLYEEVDVGTHVPILTRMGFSKDK